MKFKGKAYVVPGHANSNPDAYLVIDSETKLGIVVRIGSKAFIEDLEQFAADLNEWAGK